MAVATSGTHSPLVLRRDGTVLAWGENTHGQIGSERAIQRKFGRAFPLPTEIPLPGDGIAGATAIRRCPHPSPSERQAARVGQMIVPNIKLKGVTRADNVRLEVTLEGSISVDAAKAAVTEVLENLKKADFSKVK